jgi:signal transduction histidine kinase
VSADGSADGSAARSRHRVGRVPRAVALGLVLLGLGAAAVVLLETRSNASLEADVRTRTVAASAAPVVAAQLRGAVEEASTGTGSATSRRRISFERAEARGIPVATAVRARDTARPLLQETGVVVVATYDGGAAPETVAERRRTVSGLVVVPLELRSTLAGLRPAGGGIGVSGPQRVVAQVPRARPPDSPSYRTELSPTLAPDWSVTVWVPSPRVPAPAWGMAAALVLAGLGAALALVRRERRAAAVEDELARMREQSATLTGLVGLAQHSLDLAVVLPAVTAQLASTLGLRGVALTSTTARGERPLYTAGEQPGEPVTPGLPTSVASGQTASLVLSRGGRAVARLQVVAGRPLDSHDMVTLTGAAEILASALANAETFAQQRELLHRLRSLDELKTVFLATASHELRTPVGVITGFAQLLSHGIDDLEPAQVRDFAGRIDTNARQLASLVENLLDFSRLERGVDHDDEQALLDLGQTVSRVLDRQSDLALEHVLTRHTTTGLLVRGREHAVERVVTNLVGNAAKYSPSGTTIRVRVQSREGRAELVVDDEGPGVPVAEREQVFSRFFRGGGDEVVKTRGAGLGLAIVREFATSMGGQVSVGSAPTGGARFVVSYPLADQEQPTEGGSDVAS